MKKFIYLLCVYMLLGCERFVEIPLPNDQLTKSIVFQDDKLAKAAMAGVYRSLFATGYLSGSSQGAGMYLGCYTDELICYQPQSSGISQFYQLGITPQSTIIRNLWEVTFNQIYMVNSVLEGLSISNGVSEPVKRQLQGEALLIRGLLHSYLTGTFGDIPYVTSIDYKVNQKIPKITSSEVLVFAIQDLKRSLDLLPNTAPKGQRIRPTKIAANVILARWYVYQKNWPLANEYASKVILETAYAPESDLQKVFLKEGSSAIWQLQPDTAQSNTSEGMNYILTTAPPTLVSLTPELVNSFENADLRKTYWIGEIKDNQQRSYYFPYKYRQRSTTTATMEYSIILRTEEALLIRAEALSQMQMQTEALKDLNKLRSRAGLQSLQTNNQQVVLEAIMQERRHELFTEFGHRFFDLKNTQNLDATMSAYKPQWKGNYRIFPLPESELLLNPALNPQNDGY